MSFDHNMDVQYQRKTLATKVAYQVDLLTGSMATTLRVLVVVPTHPRAAPLALIIMKTAIHGFSLIRCSRVQPFVPLSLILTEAMPMNKFYLQEDPVVECSSGAVVVVSSRLISSHDLHPSRSFADAVVACMTPIPSPFAPSLHFSSGSFEA